MELKLTVEVFPAAIWRIWTLGWILEWFLEHKNQRTCIRDQQISHNLPIFVGGDQRMQMYGNFEGFPLNSALFGLVMQWPPEL